MSDHTARAAVHMQHLPCTSTPIPTGFPHATFMTMCAILGPTPFNLHSPFTVAGMSPPYSVISVSVVFLMYSALRL